MARRFRTKKLQTASEVDQTESVDVPITLPLDRPILIRLREPLGKLPAGILLQLPQMETLMIVRRGLCSVVGTLAATADLVLTRQELPDTGLFEALGIVEAVS
jgi:hypothetical protein